MGNKNRRSSEHRNPFEKKAVKTKKVDGDPVRLFVDYSRPLAGMIGGCRFDHVNSNITKEHFPINHRSNGQVEMKVFSAKDLVGEERSVTSEEVMRILERKGYRPAELPEGLAYAKANPDESQKYPIVILGSVWRDFDGYRGVPFLLHRKLDLDRFEVEWYAGCRFLAVRK